MHRAGAKASSVQETLEVGGRSLALFPQHGRGERENNLRMDQGSDSGLHRTIKTASLLVEGEEPGIQNEKPPECKFRNHEG